MCQLVPLLCLKSFYVFLDQDTSHGPYKVHRALETKPPSSTPDLISHCSLLYGPTLVITGLHIDELLSLLRILPKEKASSLAASLRFYTNLPSGATTLFTKTTSFLSLYPGFFLYVTYQLEAC